MKPLSRMSFIGRAALALALSASLPERAMARRRAIYMTGPAMLLIPQISLDALSEIAIQAAQTSEHADLAAFGGGVLVLDTEPTTYPWEAPGSSTTLIADPFGLASRHLAYFDDILVLKVVLVPGKIRVIPWTRLDERRFRGLVEFGRTPIQALRALGWAEGDVESEAPLPFDAPIGEEPPPAPPHHYPRLGDDLLPVAEALASLAWPDRPGWIQGTRGWIRPQLEAGPRPEAYRRG